MRTIIYQTDKDNENTQKKTNNKITSSASYISIKLN